MSKIFIVDNNTSTRKGLGAILNIDSNNQIIGEAASAEELFDKINHIVPDIIILDLEMPGMGGEKALIKLKELFPDIKVIIYSMYFESWLIDKLISDGANGFIPKGCDDDIILLTLNSIKLHSLIDNKFISEALISKLKDRSKRPFLNPHNLSGREIEVLILTCNGKANKEIASELKIVERTVELHKTHIYAKTNLKKVADLVLYSIKHGLF